MEYKIFFSRLYKITRVIIIIAPVLLLFWLVQKDLVKNGRLEFIYDFSEDSPTITNLFPANRLSQINKIVKTNSYWQQLEKEPVYFETRLPQTFATAIVEVTYKNDTQPLIQLGLETMGENEWNYDFKPLENQLLDNLDWYKIEGEQGSLWQREKTFLALDQFLDQAQNLNNFAAYDYPVNRKFIIPAYQPQDKETVINRSLRGEHSFYTYIKNEPLDFEFIVQDVNRSEGPDYLTIRIYNDQNIKIYEQEVEDDGLISKHDPASLPRNIKVKVANLAEGTYKVILDCEDEIFFRKIITKQKYLTFINKLYLVDNPEYSDGFVDLNYKPTVIYSTIPRLGFETSHLQGIQDIGINDEKIQIQETHKYYYFTPAKIPSLIYLPKNDIKISGRGLMALSQETYFNPEIYQLRDLTGFSDINYLISGYHTPELGNGWKVNQVKFDLAKAKITNRKLRFAISVPELNDQKDVIPLKQIKVILIKDPLSWKEIFYKGIDYLKNNF
ncbi:hypothetical protein KKF32_04255 [Patescibacteria group bacterium]|nr:hypothetical protein [Patescibacteria group bacterium]